MGGDWLTDILNNQGIDEKEQIEIQMRFADECRTILRNCPLFVERLGQMIAEDDNRVDTMTGDNLYKAIGARGRVKDIYGNLQHWADFKPEKEGE